MIELNEKSVSSVHGTTYYWTNDVRSNVGKVAKYNREWAKQTGFPLVIIKGAAHNSNDDQPETVNEAILDFVKTFA